MAEADLQIRGVVLKKIFFGWSKNKGGAPPPPLETPLVLFSFWATGTCLILASRLGLHFLPFILVTFWLALPNGWFQFGSKVYKFFQERKNWKNAEQVCQAEGGNLVSVTSERENRFVFDMFARNTTNDTAAGENFYNWNPPNAGCDVIGPETWSISRSI